MDNSGIEYVTCRLFDGKINELNRYGGRNLYITEYLQGTVEVLD